MLDPKLNEPLEIAKRFLEGRSIWMSGISEMEVLCFPNLSERDRHTIRSFFDHCKIMNLNKDIKEIAIQIRMEHRIKLPDAIIAATAIHLNFPLFTTDKDFSRIGDLQSVIIDM